MADTTQEPTTQPLKDGDTSATPVKNKQKKKKKRSKKSKKKHNRATTGVKNANEYNRSGRAYTLKSTSNDINSVQFRQQQEMQRQIEKQQKNDPNRQQRPHHSTVASLASINGSFVVQELTKASQDLKIQHELRKALEELRVKEQDFLMAVEITENLNKENNELRNEVEEYQLQIQELNLDNQIMAEKMGAISRTYQQDMNRYQTDIEEHKEIMAQLELELQQKEKYVDLLEDKVNVAQQQQNMTQQLAKNKPKSQNTKPSNFNSLAAKFQSISQLTSGSLNSQLEKELFVKLEQEKRRNMEQMETFMDKLDELQKIQKSYDTLKTQYLDLEEALKEQLEHQRHIQKAMQEEVIALAARNSALEHQKDEYANLLDQRDYEIEMLNQQIDIERKHSIVGGTRPYPAMSVTSEDFKNLADMGMDMGGINENQEQDDYEDEYEDDEDDESTEIRTDEEEEEDEGNLDDTNKEKKEENDEVDFDAINSMIDDMIESEQEQKEKEKKEKEKEQEKEKEKLKSKPKSSTSTVDDVFVPDVIKEYLHLTASAVKIKYPKVSHLTSEELITQAKSLPFFQYHDYMVRIMDKEMTLINLKSKQLQIQERERLQTVQKQRLAKRRSFLGLFGALFSGDDKNAKPNKSVNDVNKVNTKDVQAPLNRIMSNEELSMTEESYNDPSSPQSQSASHSQIKYRGGNKLGSMEAVDLDGGYNSGQDGYESGGGDRASSKKRHSKSRFTSKKKRGARTAVHASSRRLRGN